MLYTGSTEKEVFIVMGYRGLIHSSRLDDADIFYDARRECFVSKREAERNYPYEIRHDDGLWCNYCTLINQKVVPKPLFLQRVKKPGKIGACGGHVVVVRN